MIFPIQTLSEPAFAKSCLQFFTIVSLSTQIHKAINYLPYSTKYGSCIFYKFSAFDPAVRVASA